MSKAMELLKKSETYWGKDGNLEMENEKLLNFGKKALSRTVLSEQILDIIVDSIRLNTEFHETILEISGNRLLLKIMKTLHFGY